MTLKPDRQEDAVELRYFLNEVADAGLIVCKSTSGSGVAMDATANLATVKATTSGALPIGLLLNEFVSVDQTRQYPNWHKDQADLGDKAAILTKGWVVTDKIVGTAIAGRNAVLVSSGFVTNSVVGNGNDENINHTVGRFRTGSDEDGFATLYVDL